MRDALEATALLAVDTESNSLHAYQERVCLIQISTDDDDFIVDPLSIAPDQLDFFAAALANPSLEKVLHAAEYDIMVLRRDFGWTIVNLFDTMIAGTILGIERVGLGNMLEARYGVKVNKRHQRADWGRRPLPKNMLRYAQIDTHYLIDLRDDLYRQLRDGNHLEEAYELFDEVCHAEWNGHTGYNPDGFWGINGVRDLVDEELPVLAELYRFRDVEAQRRDVPVFKVFSDSALITITQTQPSRLEDLNGVAGRNTDRYGTALIAAVARGKQAPIPERPQRSPMPPTDVLNRFDALREWRKMRARRRGVSSEVIMAKDALWALARANPRTLDDLRQVKHIGPWRAETYGDDLLKVLRRT